MVGGWVGRIGWQPTKHSNTFGPFQGRHRSVCLNAARALGYPLPPPCRLPLPSAVVVRRLPAATAGGYGEREGRQRRSPPHARSMTSATRTLSG
eukprot:533823-Prymnesium_polylepis.1